VYLMLKIVLRLKGSSATGRFDMSLHRAEKHPLKFQRVGCRHYDDYYGIRTVVHGRNGWY
jgi:hypothetical protein